MAQETKVGLLVGLALILLVGLVLSDLFTSGPAETDSENTSTGFAGEAQAGIYAETPNHANPELTDRRTYDGGPQFPGHNANTGRPPTIFESQPAPAYHAPRETATPNDSPSPRYRSEPPLPEPDTLEALDTNAALVRESLEAMRLTPSLPGQQASRLDLDRELLIDVNREQASSETLAHASTQADRSTPGQALISTLLPDESAAPAPSQPVAGATVFFHDVQRGETLIDIARQHYNTPEFSRAIALANPEKLSASGGVRPGVRLEIPPLGSPVFSELFEPVEPKPAAKLDRVPALPKRAPRQAVKEILVQPGDTLSELASEHLGSSTRWDQLLEANADRLDSAQDLRSGMKLRLPDVDQPAPQAATRETAAAPERRQAPSPANRTAEPRSAAATYTVQAGDNLTRIAKSQLGDGELWDELLKANADQLSRPEALQVGMVLRLPGRVAIDAPRVTEPAAEVSASRRANTDKTYVVQPGDNLTRIAKSQLGDGERWRELFEANADQLASPDALAAGQTLRLP